MAKFKITKADFVSAITATPSYFIGALTTRNLDVDRLVDVMQDVNTLDPSGYDLRTVASRRATFLEFTGGSRLYLDGHEYFRLGNALAAVVHGAVDKVVLYRLAEGGDLE